MFAVIAAAAFLASAGIDEYRAGFVVPEFMNLPPSRAFPLGTDPAGRCMVGRLMLGARNSLLIAGTVTVLSGAAGILYGLVSGFAGGIVDNAMMRLLDFFLMLPSLLIIIAVLSMLGDYGVWQFSLIMTAFLWADRARLLRAKALQQAGLDYVAASRTLGTPRAVIMLREVLPNLAPVITVNMTLTLASNIGLETGLTFLGYGLPIGTPSLGTLISYAAVPTVMLTRPWQWLPAAMLVFVMMLSVYLVGQAAGRAADSSNT